LRVLGIEPVIDLNGILKYSTALDRLQQIFFTMEKRMRYGKKIGWTFLLSLLSLNVAYAETKHGSCEKMYFSSFQPAPNKYLQTFNEFSFETSANIVPASIVVNISFGEVGMHFDHNDLSVTTHRNGHTLVRGRLDRALEHGFARINITGHSKPGCEKTEGYLVRLY